MAPPCRSLAVAIETGVARVTTVIPRAGTVLLFTVGRRDSTGAPIHLQENSFSGLHSFYNDGREDNAKLTDGQTGPKYNETTGVVKKKNLL